MKKIISLIWLFSILSVGISAEQSQDALNEQLNQLSKEERSIQSSIVELEKKREECRHNVTFSGNAFTNCKVMTFGDCKELEKLYTSACNDLGIVLKKLGLQNKMLTNVLKKRRDLLVDQLIAKNL